MGFLKGQDETQGVSSRREVDGGLLVKSRFADLPNFARNDENNGTMGNLN